MIKKSFNKTELLIPVGSSSKLTTAIHYGADAVYLGGIHYGLRFAAENFNDQELTIASKKCHQAGVKIFVVINSFFHDQDFEHFQKFINLLNKINIDALIVSDIGVIKYLNCLTTIPIHLSTQSSCLNVSSAKFWKSKGVSRIVLGREVSIDDGIRIKKEADIEVEMFIHGSMCMAYSGQCTISNYTQGRDSNRGGCAHSCRFDYKLKSNDDEVNDYFMSSNDLQGIAHLPKFLEGQIDSLKIEGRMKTIHYVGTVAKTYREAIDFYYKNGRDNWDDYLQQRLGELDKISHRKYFDSNLDVPMKGSGTHHERESVESSFQAIGEVIEVISEDEIILQASHKFLLGDHLEILSFKNKNTQFVLESLTDIFGKEIESSRPGQIVRMPYLGNVQKHNLVRKILI